MTEPIIICWVLSPDGITLAKEFNKYGRDVIGVDTIERARDFQASLAFLTQMMVSPDPVGMASVISGINGHCGIIEANKKLSSLNQ